MDSKFIFPVFSLLHFLQLCFFNGMKYAASVYLVYAILLSVYTFFASRYREPAEVTQHHNN